MTVHDALFERVRRVNPVASSEPVDTITLRRLVDDRIDTPRRLTRGPLIAAAVAVALFAVLIPLVLLNADPGPVVTETTLPTPTTTPTTAPATTTTRPTTTTSAMSPPPVTISWTRVDEAALSVPDLYLTGVAVSNGNLIATGAIRSDDTMTGVILVSANGETWSQIEDPSLASSNALSVAARGEVVVVAGLTGTETISANGLATSDTLVPAIWRSADAGATWESIPIEGDGVLYTVLATDQGFIAAGYGIWISTDGLEWRKVSDEEIIWGLAETPDGLVAAGNRFTPPPSTTTIWESFDGETWSRARGQGDALESDPVSASLANDVESADGTTLVVGGRRTAMDGPFRAAVWRLEGDGAWARLPQDTEIFGGAQIVNMNALVNADGVWIAAGDMSDEAMTFRMGRVWASEDGDSWFRLDPEGDVFGTYGDGFVAVRNLTFDGERLIAVGQRFGVGAVWVGAIEP